MKIPCEPSAEAPGKLVVASLEELFGGGISEQIPGEFMEESLKQFLERYLKVFDENIWSNTWKNS